jgi:predicted nucleotidyltransferase component of viral defense system
MLQTVSVDKDTLLLLKKLQSIEELKDMRLVGGTALALYLGHRKSIDLDLFGNHNLDVEELINIIQKQDIDVELTSSNENACGFFLNNIKVDIVKYSYPWLKEVYREDDIRLARKEDISAMKLLAITKRGTKKDFIDLFFLLKEYSLKQMLNFFQEKYPKMSLFMVIKSLDYFADAEQYSMPKMLVDVSWQEVKEKIRQEVKAL